MPKKLTTLILLLGAMSAGSWVYWDLTRTPPKPAGLGPLFDSLDAEHVTHIQIVRPPSDATADAKPLRLTFQRKDKTWRLMEPETGPAAPELVRDMLQNPTRSWPTAFVKVEEPEKFGLGKEAIEVTFVTSGQEKSFRIGIRSKFQNGIYVKRLDSSQAMLMDLDFSRPYIQPIRKYLSPKTK